MEIILAEQKTGQALIQTLKSLAQNSTGAVLGPMGGVELEEV